MYNGHLAQARPRDDINSAVGDGAEKANLQQGSPFATLVQRGAGRKAMAVCVVKQIRVRAKPVFSLPLETAYASSTTITARVLNLVAESAELWQQHPALVGMITLRGIQLVPLDPDLKEAVIKGGMHQMLYVFDNEALGIIKDLVWTASGASNSGSLGGAPQMDPPVGLHNKPEAQQLCPSSHIKTQMGALPSQIL
jgi:hypothetical protein